MGREGGGVGGVGAEGQEGEGGGSNLAGTNTRGVKQTPWRSLRSTQLVFGKMVSAEIKLFDRGHKSGLDSRRVRVERRDELQQERVNRETN